MSSIEKIADDLRNSASGFGVFDVAVDTEPGGRRSIEAPVTSAHEGTATLLILMAPKAPGAPERVALVLDGPVLTWRAVKDASADAVLLWLRSGGFSLVPLDENEIDG